MRACACHYGHDDPDCKPTLRLCTSATAAQLLHSAALEGPCEQHHDRFPAWLLDLPKTYRELCLGTQAVCPNLSL